MMILNNRVHSYLTIGLLSHDWLLVREFGFESGLDGSYIVFGDRAVRTSGAR